MLARIKRRDTSVASLFFFCFFCMCTFKSALGTAATQSAPSHEQTLITSRVDGSPIEIILVKSPAATQLPIVLVIDGSGCVGARRDRFRTQYEAIPTLVDQPIATLIVEKPGVEPRADWGSACSDIFKRYYSIDQRVFDHLRAIQYLRKHAPWWNGEIYVWAWSDGGVIGSHVAAYTPEVKRAVFGGTGGGISMAEQFEDHIICAPDRAPEREACVAALRKQFQDIRDNPSPLQTWSGDDNTYRTWATRLDAVEFHIMKDIHVPVLIVHGAQDRDGTPVESARELMNKLRAEGVKNFEYWEVPDMGHGIGNVESVRRAKLNAAMFNWLFERPPGVGGPPAFGK